MSITLLAIDTSSEACSAALLYQSQIKERYQIAPRQHTQLILPMMQALLDEIGLRLCDLDVLAFTRGPGSFTGIRISASIIQAVATVINCSVVPVSSLQCLAQGAYRMGRFTKVFSAIDARLNQMYCAWYSYKEGIMSALTPEKLICLNELKLEDITHFRGVGCGWERYHTAKKPNVNSSLHQQGCLPRYPRACDAVVIAAKAYQRGEFVSAEEALPVYLRETVAVNRGFSG